QKGRYREFYQCDVDVIGSTSMINELELIQIVDEVFRRLGVRVLLKINNRKILYGIAETIGYAEKMIDITVAIDKLDKIGLEAVNAELQERGISAEAVEMLQPILSLEGTNREKLAKIAQIISGSETGLKGVDEMSRVLDYVEAVGVELPIELDLSLARGLNYYTGAIFEVKALDYQIGSISGGGRYDDLTGIFGLPGMSGVGISFGADRIYDVMLGLNLFPNDAKTSTHVLFVNFGGAEELESLKVMRALRATGYSCEIYPESVKMKKQMDYANKRAIPYVAIIGETERTEGKVVIKRMSDGTQNVYSVGEELENELRNFVVI
ncbi:MAG: ATP phosphoribosyltransferase regulatory subunit, partial [Rikenellaceae bacterium]|nr:ATP phosphoribosyltransferase regulatory subunit [Rikenellaceae bacterium]